MTIPQTDLKAQLKCVWQGLNSLWNQTVIITDRLFMLSLWLCCLPLAIGTVASPVVLFFQRQIILALNREMSLQSSGFRSRRPLHQIKVDSLHLFSAWLAGEPPSLRVGVLFLSWANQEIGRLLMMQVRNQLRGLVQGWIRHGREVLSQTACIH